MAFDAFISYARGPDSRIASGLRSALHKFAKKPFETRALRVFLDVATLDVAGHLPERLSEAVLNSEHLILLASPESAASPWVNEEVRVWLEANPLENLVIILTDGELVFDPVNARFDPEHSTAAPKALLERVNAEPLWLDSRHWRSAVDLTLNNVALKMDVARVSARIKRQPLDNLIGEDITQSRRLVRYRNIAISGLILLTVISVGAAFFAESQRRNAVREALVSGLLADAAIAKSNVAIDPIASRELASSALRRNMSSAIPVLREVHETGLEVLNLSRGMMNIQRPLNSNMNQFFTIRDLTWAESAERLLVTSDRGVFMLDKNFQAMCPPIPHPKGRSHVPMKAEYHRQEDVFVVGGNIVPTGTSSGPAFAGWVKTVSPECEVRELSDYEFGPLESLIVDNRFITVGSRFGYIARRSIEGPWAGVQLVNAAQVNGLSVVQNDLLAFSGPSPIRMQFDDHRAFGFQSFGADENRAPVYSPLMELETLVIENVRLGREFLTGSADGVVQLWKHEYQFETDEYAIRSALRLNAFASPVVALAESKQLDLYAAASRSGEVVVFRPDGVEISRFNGHDDFVQALEWLPDGRLLSASQAGGLRVWDFTDRFPKRAFPDQSGTLIGASIEPDRSFAVMENDGEIKVSESSQGNWPSRDVRQAGIDDEFFVSADINSDQSALVLASVIGAPESNFFRLMMGQTPEIGQVEIWTDRGEIKSVLPLPAPPTAVAFGRRSENIAIAFGFGLTMENMMAGFRDVVDAPPYQETNQQMSQAVYERGVKLAQDAIMNVQGGLTLVSSTGEVVREIRHPKAHSVDFVVANPWASDVAFASGWGSRFVQFWSESGDPIGAPIEIIDESGALRKVNAAKFLAGGLKLVLSIGPFADTNIDGSAMVVDGDPEHYLVFVDLVAGTARSVATDHEWPIDVMTTDASGEILMTAGGGLPEDGTRFAALWSSTGIAIGSRIPLSGDPIIEGNLTENGAALLLDSRGTLRSFSAMPNAVMLALQERERIGNEREIAEHSLDEIRAIEDNTEAWAAVSAFLESSPNADAFILRAGLHESAGRIERARLDLLAAQQFTPFDWLTAHAYADFEFRMQNYALAAEYYTATLRYFDAAPLLPPPQETAIGSVSFDPAMEMNNSNARGLILQQISKAQCLLGEPSEALHHGLSAFRHGVRSPYTEAINASPQSACPAELAN